MKKSEKSIFLIPSNHWGTELTEHCNTHLWNLQKRIEIRGNVNKTCPLKSPLFIHLQHLIHKINIYVTTQTYKPFYFHGSIIACSWILRDKCRIIERGIIEFWALWIMFSVPRDNLQHLVKIRDAVVIILFGNLQHFIRQHTIGQWRTFLIKPSMPSTSAMLFV